MPEHPLAYLPHSPCYSASLVSSDFAVITFIALHSQALALGGYLVHGFYIQI